MRTEDPKETKTENSSLSSQHWGHVDRGDEVGTPCTPFLWVLGSFVMSTSEQQRDQVP